MGQQFFMLVQIIPVPWALFAAVFVPFEGESDKPMSYREDNYCICQLNVYLMVGGCLSSV